MVRSVEEEMKRLRADLQSAASQGDSQVSSLPNRNSSVAGNVRGASL